jgi:hypothetical protein
VIRVGRHDSEPLADAARRTELSTSRLVGVATGIIMTTYKTVYEQAFALLRFASRRQDRRVRDVAEEIVVAANATMSDGVGVSAPTLRSRLKSILSP